MPYLGSSPARGLVGTTDIDASAVTQAKIADDAVSLAKIASGTDGELITWDASGNPAAVAAGTSGHFLKSQGAGSVPVFAEAGGGSLNYISSVTISNGDGEFSSMDEYEAYFIRFERMVGSASAQNRIQLHQAGAASDTYVTASSYIYAAQAYSQSGNPRYASRGADHIPVTETDPGSKFMSGWMYVYLKGKSATGTMIHANTFGEENATGFETGRVISGMLDTGTIIDGIKFYRNSGNYTSGTLHLYGIGQS